MVDLISNHQIYLVDDDPSIRHALTWLLDAAGIKLVTFASAAAFLDAVDTMQPGCVLLDICMPEMSGVELQERLLQQEHVMSIVFLTGQADVPTTSKVFKNGAFDLLEKPVDAEHLIEVIKNALQVSQQKYELVTERQELAQKIASLTERETQVLKLVLEGAPNKVIADRLHVALRTAEIHRHNMMSKMGQDSAIKLAHILSRHTDLIL